MMNKRQWQILVAGTVAMVLVMVFGITHPPKSVVGPWIQVAPGEYTQETTDAVMSIWVPVVSLGIVILTGVFVYRSRGQGAA